MEEYKDMDDLDIHNTVIKVFWEHKRKGFSKAQIEIYHCLIEKDPGFSFGLYDEDTETDIGLIAIAEKDCQNVNLHEFAIRLANEIMDKTGSDIKVINEIQGSPMQYDEHEEKMWHARMVMRGIDDDY